MVNIKIHRGTSQIGGTITEIYTENSHIFIDFGSELMVNPEGETNSKMMNVINNAACDAVLFSHYHGDHVGLLEYIPKKDIQGKDIILGIGKVARQVLVNIQETLANDTSSQPEERQVHKEMLNLLQDNSRWLDFTDALTEGNEQSSSFDIGDFHITTIRVDHSAYDSYMFVIEAEGKCIVHTGDFRVHGRLGEGFFDELKKFMENKKVDVLLMEGTMLGRLDEKPMHEEELQEEATRLLKMPENKYVFLICSSTNMESLASFYKAVLFSNKDKASRGDKDCKRAMYVNHYVKQQMNLFASAESDITWKFRKAYPFEQQGKYNEALGMSQMEYMKENGFLILLGKSEGYKKYIKPFEKENPLLIYSMWNGYVDDKTADTYDEKWGTLYHSFKRKVKLHTSGHAVKKDLEEMTAIVNSRQAVIPIHTEFKQAYYQLEGIGNRVKILDDGEVWSIGKELEEKKMITKEQMDGLLKSINKFNIPEKHKKNIFWCPKVVNHLDGVVLYIYGGSVLDISFTQKGLMAHIFGRDYCKYFHTEMRGDEIRNEFIEENRYQKGLSVLENWKEEIWEEICEAFKKCAEMKPAYERMRENRICSDNMCNDEISIFAMEERIPVDNKNPKMDMLAIREEDGKKILSYIEYKCTDTATESGTSIPEHYADMKKIISVSENTKKMLQLYGQKQAALGKDIQDIHELECSSEIVFMISNIQWQGNVEDKNQKVSAQVVYNKLKETEEREDFKSENVKVVLLDEIDVESDEQYILYTENMLTIKEAMEKIQEKQKNVCN